MVQALTDNRNRTVSEIRKVFERRGGNLGTTGCVAWMFERKGLILVEAQEVEEDDLLAVALEAGAEDLKAGDQVYEVTCVISEFAALRQAFENDVRVLMLGHLAIGLPLGHMALEEIAAEYGAEYGVDYANLGYRPGYIAVMIAMGREIGDIYSTDYRGTPIREMPVTEHIHSYGDIDLLFGFEHGAVIDYWVRYAQARFDQRMAFGTTAVMAPDAYPYLQSQQIEGLVGGLKGAAEYETLVGHPDLGTRGMPAQEWGHLLVIGFIVMGNLGYFFTRRRKGGGE